MNIQHKEQSVTPRLFKKTFTEHDTTRKMLIKVWIERRRKKRSKPSQNINLDMANTREKQRGKSFE